MTESHDDFISLSFVPTLQPCALSQGGRQGPPFGPKEGPLGVHREPSQNHSEAVLASFVHILVELKCSGLVRKGVSESRIFCRVDGAKQQAGLIGMCQLHGCRHTILKD